MKNLEDIAAKLLTLNEELETIQASHHRISKDINTVIEDINSLTLSANSNNQKDRKKAKQRKLTLDVCKSILGSRVRILNPKPS